MGAMIQNPISITLYADVTDRIIAVAECNGVQVGWATFIIDDPDYCAFCLEIEIASDHQRRGIMSQMYSEVETRIGHHLVPSKQLTPESAAYWNKRGVPLRNGTEIKPKEQRDHEASQRPRMRMRVNGVEVDLED